MTDKPTLEQLMAAARQGDAAAVEAMLAAGADAGAADVDGNTPLMYAAARGQADVCRLLRAAGADPGHANRWGLTAFDWVKWAPDGADVRRHLT